MMAPKFALSATDIVAPPPVVRPEKPPLAVTESAAKRLAVILSREKPGAMMRVAVEGGGCSGFQYKLDFDTSTPADDDALFGEVVVDATSLEYLKDSMLDYVESLGTASFEIRNPHATAKCGCGNSFSL